MTTQQFSIVDGPSKFDLMVSLFKKDSPVEFSTGSQKSKIRTVVLINGIQCEDGSRERWLISGVFYRLIPIENSDVCIEPSDWDGNFSGYYDSRTRTGYINKQ